MNNERRRRGTSHPFKFKFLYFPPTKQTKKKIVGTKERISINTYIPTFFYFAFQKNT